MAIKSRLLRWLCRTPDSDIIAALRAADAELNAQHVDGAWAAALEEVDREVGVREGSDAAAVPLARTAAPPVLGIVLVLGVTLNFGVPIIYDLAITAVLAVAVITAAYASYTTDRGIRGVTIRPSKWSLGSDHRRDGQSLGSDRRDGTWRDRERRAADTVLHRP